MTGGKHVTREMCKRMREMRDRGYFYDTIANEFDVSRECVNYHVNARCTHDLDAA